MEQDKKAKLLKEINDIMQEQEHIKKLLNENNMQELDDYLGGELTQKHLVEKRSEEHTSELQSQR